VRRLCFLLSLAACDAEVPPPSTGGVTLPEAGPCGRALVLVESDYQSTNVAILGLDGASLSSSFISSAGASAALSAALSGDVVVPTSPVTGSEVVLLDRYPASVITWVDIATATPRAQLDVSTGFASNPQDYLEIDEDRAYVSRFDQNPSAGEEPFDQGGDILVVDPRAPAIRARIALEAAMADAPGFQPRPNRMVRSGDAVFVLLSAYSADFGDSAPSRVVRIDAARDAITSYTVLDGLHGCAGLALHGDELAVACSGKFGGGNTPTLAESAVARLTVADPPRVIATSPAAGVGQPYGLSLALTAGGDVLTTALGHFGVSGAPDAPDLLVRVAASPAVLLASGRAFELGEVACLAPADDDACGRCFATDAERGALLRLDANAGSLEATLPLDDGIGLPPRFLGRL
jgi:hypothetical protein